MYYTHTNPIIYTYPALYPKLSPSFCHLQEGSHLITLVRFPVGAIAKHARSHSDAAAEPAWFWNTLWTVWAPLETHPRRTRTSPPGQKHKLLVDDGVLLSKRIKQISYVPDFANLWAQDVPEDGAAMPALPKLVGNFARHPYSWWVQKST
jgi:hypothetical protein